MARSAVEHRKLRAGLALAALAFAALAGCRARPHGAVPRSEGDGSVWVYLRPEPGEAGRSVLTIEEISAVREDGTSIPLSLRAASLRGSELARGRLLALGSIPEGRYAGLSVRGLVQDTHAASPDEASAGSTALARLPVGFSMDASHGVVVQVSLVRGNPPGAAGGALPLAASVPGKPASGLIGVALSLGDEALLLFDKVSGVVAAAVPSGSRPASMVIDQVRHRAYVALPEEDAVQAVDLLEASIVGRARLTSGDDPVELALSSDGSTLLVVNEGSNTVSLVDPRSLVETDRIAVGNGPRSATFEPGGRRAFVLNALSNSISVVDVPARSVVATLATEADPLRADLSRDGRRLFVAHRSAPWLLVLDTVTFERIRRVQIVSGASALRVDPRSDRVYLARRFADTIDVYDPSSFLPVETIPVAGEVSFLAVDAEERTLWIALGEPGRLRAVRLVGGRDVVETDAGKETIRVSVMGEK